MAMAKPFRKPPLTPIAVTVTALAIIFPGKDGVAVKPEMMPMPTDFQGASHDGHVQRQTW